MSCFIEIIASLYKQVIKSVFNEAFQTFNHFLFNFLSITTRFLFLFFNPQFFRHHLQSDARGVHGRRRRPLFNAPGRLCCSRGDCGELSRARTSEAQTRSQTANVLRRFSRINIPQLCRDNNWKMAEKMRLGSCVGKREFGWARAWGDANRGE